MNKTKQFLSVDYKILKINTITNQGKVFKFTDSLKNTYSYLAGWTTAFPSYNQIADVFGISRDAAKDRINKLIEMGLIEKNERWAGDKRTSNLYTVLPLRVEDTTGRTYSENKGTRHEVKEEQEAPTIKYHVVIDDDGDEIPSFSR